MGMTIDEARTALGKERKYALHENKQAFDIAIDVMCNYQMMQADYNARLKASMAAMLEELKTEFEEITISEATVPNEIFWNMGANAMKKEIGTRIQEKIDRLKGNENENGNE